MMMMMMRGIKSSLVKLILAQINFTYIVSISFVTFLYNNLIIATYTKMKYFKQLIIILILPYLLNCSSVIIPLSYSLDPNSSQKYPIKFSFNSSITTVPF
jgi:hypothetical protein